MENQSFLFRLPDKCIMLKVINRGVGGGKIEVPCFLNDLLPFQSTNKNKLKEQ